MIEFKTEDEIVSFDGRVISRFRQRGMSLHFHIDFVESLEIKSHKKGKYHWLKINLKENPSSDVRAIMCQSLAPEEFPAAQAFIDEVMRVIASQQK